MNDFPGHQNVRPDPQDEECYDTCEIHGDYPGMGGCPLCGRRQALRHVAIIGLQSQIDRLTKHNAVDKKDLVADIKRALNYLRLYT